MLNIPKKIKIGFQERTGTYTGKLGYVIYYDGKGILRKETSWEGWRNTKIDPIDCNNVKTSGFVINKKVGGYSGSHFDIRQAYIRVFDPRGFEFEITVPNLVHIIENTTITKGGVLEGEFVYAWDGKELVLLPCESLSYQENKKFIEQPLSPLRVRDLEVGKRYIIHTQYLGKHDTAIYLGKHENKRDTSRKWFHVWTSDNDGYTYICDKSAGIAKFKYNEPPVDNINDLIAEYYKSSYGCNVVSFTGINKLLDDIKDRDIFKKFPYFLYGDKVYIINVDDHTLDTPIGIINDSWYNRHRSKRIQTTGAYNKHNNKRDDIYTKLYNELIGIHLFEFDLDKFLSRINTYSKYSNSHSYWFQYFITDGSLVATYSSPEDIKLNSITEFKEGDLNNTIFRRILYDDNRQYIPNIDSMGDVYTLTYIKDGVILPERLTKEEFVSNLANLIELTLESGNKEVY